MAEHGEEAIGLIFEEFPVQELFSPVESLCRSLPVDVFPDYPWIHVIKYTKLSLPFRKGSQFTCYSECVTAGFNQ